MKLMPYDYKRISLEAGRCEKRVKACYEGSREAVTYMTLVAVRAAAKRLGLPLPPAGVVAIASSGGGYSVPASIDTNPKISA